MTSNNVTIDSSPIYYRVVSLSYCILYRIVICVVRLDRTYNNIIYTVCSGGTIKFQLKSHYKKLETVKILFETRIIILLYLSRKRRERSILLLRNVR